MNIVLLTAGVVAQGAITVASTAVLGFSSVSQISEPVGLLVLGLAMLAGARGVRRHSAV